MTTPGCAGQVSVAAAAPDERSIGRIGTLLRRARAAWIVSPAAPSHQPGIGIFCPRCRAASGAMALLTSDVAYFACNACRHRWAV